MEHAEADITHNVFLRTNMIENNNNLVEQNEKKLPVTFTMNGNAIEKTSTQHHYNNHNHNHNHNHNYKHGVQSETTTINNKRPTQPKSERPFYCPHCKRTFERSFFRNAQQFGAHCSNCSRGRVLQDHISTVSAAERPPYRRHRRKDGEKGPPKRRGRRPKHEREIRKRKNPFGLVKGKKKKQQQQQNDDLPPTDPSSIRKTPLIRSIKRKHWENLDTNPRGRKFFKSPQIKRARLVTMPMSVRSLNELPRVLLIRVLSYLKVGELATMGMSSRYLADVCNADRLWKPLFCNEWDESIGQRYPGRWKLRYKAKKNSIKRQGLLGKIESNGNGHSNSNGHGLENGIEALTENGIVEKKKKKHLFNGGGDDGQMMMNGFSSESESDIESEDYGLGFGYSTSSGEDDDDFHRFHMMMDDGEEDMDEDDYVPLTKDQREKQRREFLDALNREYKPVILFFDKNA